MALSWGHALQAMVYATTADHDYHGVTLVQLVGGLSSISNEISGQELVRELAVRLGRRLPLPARPGHPGVDRVARDALLAEPSIADALEAAARADIAVRRHRHPDPRLVGGDPRLAAASTRRGNAGFWAQQPVGDVAARYYNAERPARSAAPSTTASSPSPSRTCSRSPTSSASPTAGPRRPASSAPCAATSSTPSSATRALARSVLSDAGPRPATPEGS